ncbi:GDSL-type esterase/lipase family protein [uncultured Jannaschia sp.]|uniref:GDSL-type esterase/lipase family protein n=1 Tax=uncultured Jannaschia sp. TaxID=293347 RepID=UPI002636181E|nr:GDSL-type esterase/lipase family protein [uncultured Jannaschia sp.]
MLYGLGDSVTFGEDDLRYEPSDGDRGYVGRFADALAAQEGERPIVRNFAIDGETASSFMTGNGRTPPVVVRTDAILALQNTNYSETGGIRTQETQFRQAAAQDAAAGNDIVGITVTLGFNELAALASLPTDEALAQIPATLDDYEGNYRSVLSTIRAEAPDAPLYLLGYYNPFPADPDSPAAPIFNEAGTDLNGIISMLAGDYGASFVDVAPAFVGNEAEYTFLDDQPAGFVINGPFGGVEPIGNVHATDAGYDAIAGVLTAQVAPVPLPAGLPLYAAGLLGAGLVLRRSKRRT